MTQAEAQEQYDLARQMIEAGLGHEYKWEKQTMASSDPQMALRAKKRELQRAEDMKRRTNAKVERLKQEIAAIEDAEDPINQISHLIWLKLVLAFDFDPLDGTFEGDEDEEEDVDAEIDNLISKVKRGRFERPDMRELARVYNLCISDADRTKLQTITEQIVQMVKDSMAAADEIE